MILFSVTFTRIYTITMFDIKGDKIQLSTEDLSIPPFKTFYNESKDKNKALKEIEYVIWLYKWNSPYLAYPPAERPSKVSKDVFDDDKFKPDERINELAERFNEFQTTPLIRLYQASEDSAEYIIKVLKSYSNDNKDYDLDVAIKISKLLKDVESTAKSLNSAKNRAKAEEIESGKVKGGGTIGLYAMPRNK